MCCLFGIIDCQGNLSSFRKNLLLSALAAAAEERGTDATGIAYNTGNELCIYKRPEAGRSMAFQCPEDMGTAIIGHARLTTQGEASRNYNNHPFRGKVSGHEFALAHNGMIWNDKIIRESLGLPKSYIETDSFIAVQLLEKQESLSFESLKSMVEQLRGSFTFTVLDDQDNLYIVKGENPMCIYYYPKKGVYVYASTEQILKTALKGFRMKGKKETLRLSEGEILKIDNKGQREWDYFEPYDDLYDYGCFYGYEYEDYYREDLKAVAASLGHNPKKIDLLIQQGFTLEEIEEFLYEEEEW